MILVVLGIVMILYFLLVNICTGASTFSGIFLVIGIVLIVFSKYKEKIFSIGIVKNHILPIKVIFFICVGIFLIFQAALIVFPKNSESKADLVVVLGAGIRGESLTLTLQDRLDSALDYIEKTKYSGDILVSGGQGPGESIAESEAMRRYLVEKGVPNEKIIMEDKSTSTFENFKFSKEVLKDRKIDINSLKLKVVTTDFHGLRSKMLASRNGFRDVSLYTSRSKWYLIPTMYVREFFAFGKSFILDR